MAINTYSNQFKFSGKAPLDVKNTPVKNLTELGKILKSNRYEGLTVTVLNSDTTGIPVEYWLVGGIENPNWQIKNANRVDSYASLLLIPAESCAVGFEMVVQADETNNNQVSKYWVTSLVYEYTYENAEGEEVVTRDKAKAEAEAVESEYYGDDEHFYDTAVVGVVWEKKEYGVGVAGEDIEKE